MSVSAGMVGAFGVWRWRFATCGSGCRGWGCQSFLRFGCSAFTLINVFDGFIADLVTVRDDACLQQFVVEVEIEMVCIPEVLDKRAEIVRVHFACVRSCPPRQVRESDHFDSVDFDFFVEFGTLDVSAGFDCSIDYHGSGSHLVDHLGCDDYRSLLTEDLSSSDYNIRLNRPSRHHLALFSQLLGR